MHLRILVTLAALVALAAPAAAQGTYGFGTPVGRSDYDYTPIAAALTAAPCGIDLDGDGAYDAGEPLILHVNVATCAGSVEAVDVRLSTGDAGPAGAYVKTSDRDFNQPLQGPVNDDLLYHDADGDNEFGSKDTLYLDIIGGSATARVDVGDLRLTRAGDLAAGTLAKAGDPDVATGLKELRAATADLQDANVLYVTGGSANPLKTSRAVYINVDAGALASTAGDLGVEANDVRLTSNVAQPWGGKPDIKAVGFAYTPSTVLAGQPFQFQVDLRNDGSASGSSLVQTKMGAVVVDARPSPSLDPKAKASLVMTLVAPPTAAALEMEVLGVKFQVPVGEALQQTSAGDALVKATALEARVSELEADLASATAQLQAALADVAAMKASEAARVSATRATAPTDAELGPSAKATPGPPLPLLLLTIGVLAVAARARRPGGEA